MPAENPSDKRKNRSNQTAVALFEALIKNWSFGVTIFQNMPSFYFDLDFDYDPDTDTDSDPDY